MYGRDRKQDGPKYHVDYCFLPREWSSYLGEVKTGTFDDWVGAGLSDHVPLIVDVEVPDLKKGKALNPAKAVRTDLDGLG